MTRKSFIDAAVPRLKQYMAEKGRPITTRESAEFLGVTPSYAGDVMLYMETVDIVQQVKRGGKNYYFLKGSFDESEIDSMLPSPRATSKDGRRKRVARKRIRTDSLLKEHLESMRALANSRDGPSALSIIGLTQTQTEGMQQMLVIQEPERIEEAIKPDGSKGGILIKREIFGPVESIPKNFRLLTHEDTRYLKEQHLLGLDGYAETESFNCFFAEASALERGEYGNVFYASKSTNPWERTYKLTVRAR